LGLEENKVRATIREALIKAGWFVFHVKQKGPGCYKGISDYIACRRGRTVFVEAKALSGKQSPDQVAFMDNVRGQGGEYIVARGLLDLRKAGML